MNQTPIRSLEGSAQFNDGEFVDMRAGSEHLIPATEYNKDKERSNIERLGTEAAAAADRGIESYAEQGISDIEAWLKFMLPVGNNLAAARKEEQGDK